MANNIDDYIVDFADIPYERVSKERVLTGYPDLDYFIKGIEPGLTELIGSTNVGKSIFTSMLIKNAMGDRDTFEATVDLWSEQLAHEAAVITKFRAEFIEKVDGHVKDCFIDMSHNRELPEISYISSSKLAGDELFDVELLEKKFYELLVSNHEREIYAGATLYGAHKDDMEVILNGKPARFFASQGQQRSLAIALKLAEGEICYSEFSDYPVFLFDDVLSELDSKRRDYLINRIKGKQVIMTSCDKNEIREAKKITVSDGKYTEG